jgi:DNA-binding NtrC family response regulator
VGADDATPETAGTAGTEPLEVVVFEGERTAIFPLPGSGSLTIGRAEGSEIRIEDPSASRRHAVLHVAPELRIEDLGAVNGTFIREPPSANETGRTHSLRQLVRQSADIKVGDCLMVGSALLVVRRRSQPTGMSARSEPEMVRDPAMKALYGQASRAAAASISVLLLGETGVGKEVLARIIHARSPRAARSFVALNCAALPETLLESELFGYEKGAFSGALKSRPGLFESAEGGTVFLDEVGELSLTIQVKLLRVLEERAVLRVGGRSPKKVDVRFIAATNRDLEEELSGGQFREDLYFRLNGISLLIPPLRQRPSEIAPFSELFAADAARQLGLARPPRIAQATLERLEKHTWPGNVRELKNVMERAVVLCAGDELLLEHLPAKLVSGVRVQANVTSPAQQARVADAMEALRHQMRSVERNRIIEALEQCGGNQTLAAERLGISRRTLVSRLSEYDIPRPRKRSEP